MPSAESQKTTPAKRAIKKIRTACLVSSLARGWQQWATENANKQAQEPPGWMPGSDDGEIPSTTPKKTEKEAWKPKPPLVTMEKEVLHNSTNSAEDIDKALIRSKEVTKTVISGVHERGGDISNLTNKYETHLSTLETCGDSGDILDSNISPTRRRKCTNLVSQLTKGWKEIEQGAKDFASTEDTDRRIQHFRSESIDTQDSGYGDGEGEDKQQLDSDIITRIKRPTASNARTATNEVISYKKAYKKYSPVHNIKGRWQTWVDQHLITQKLNPFSDEFDYDLAMATRLHKGDEGYGHPKEGTKTAERAKRAETHIYREMKDMCFIIKSMAEPGPEGRIQVTFGELFDTYVNISDKVVGILMRARKHRLVHFEGEMLWQGRDDHVIITLL
ncbi:actin-binding Rho-activating protein isoform X2 [Microcaecilia unicolor]|uniref:Actin-binding Rho-activating protein n=1 Tax=Microcaecilia unicolor TaxID=1415580 RepID=A0A6P7ZER8_9AMPH|nr:actin-binding Rho-activating protein isoform X2 [Microcaecilia unicolor]